MRKKILISLLILGAGAGLLMLNLGGYSIYILDEAKNAECSREMLESGNWIVPTFNYQLRTDKPTLPYYFMAFAYRIFGVNAFAARFFSTICGGMLLVIVYWFSRHYLGKKTALIALITLASSLGFLLQYRLAVPDPYLVLLVTTSLLAFYHGLEMGRFRWFIVAYVSLGLAVMAKGPIGAIIPLVSVGSYVIGFKRKNWLVCRPMLGLLIVILIVLPWYVMVGMATDGQWLTGFFLEHNVTRYLVTREGHGGNPLLMPFFLLILLFPSSLLLAPALGSMVRKRMSPLMAYCLIVMGVVVLFFAFSATKLPNYVSPALPFAALLVATYLGQQRETEGPLLVWGGLLLVLWIAAPVVAYTIPTAYTDPIETGMLFILPICGGAAFYFFWKRWTLIAVTMIGATWAALITSLFFTLVPRLDNMNPVTASEGIIQADQDIVAYHIFNPAFSFHLKKEIPFFTEYSQLSDYLDSKNEVVVLTRSRAIGELEVLQPDTLFIHQDLFERTRTAILRLKK